MKKLPLLIMIISILVMASSALAVPVDPASVFGTVTLGGVGVSGGTSITITTASGLSQTVTTTDSTFEANLYSSYATAPQRYADTFTFSIASYTGYDSVNSVTATFDADYWGKLTRYDLAFTGTATAAAVAETSSPGGGSGVASAAPSESLTSINNVQTVNKIKDSLPKDWTNVKVEQVNQPKVVSITKANIEDALAHAQGSEAIAFLQKIKNAITNNEISEIEIIKTLTVYKATNLDTGASLYRSEITLTFVAPRNLKNIQIVEVVPKNVVQSSDDLVFSGEIPNIIQRDPILEWTFASVIKGQALDLSYIVKKRLTSITSVTLSAGETAAEKTVVEETPPPVVEQKKEPFLFSAEAWVGIMIVVFIVLIGLVIYYIYTKPQTEKKEVKTKK